VTTFNNLDISGGEMYDVADGIIIDEGGIDLLVDGEPRLAASFNDLDTFELMYAVLPEDFELPAYLSKNAWRERLGELQETAEEAKDLSEEDFEQAVVSVEVTIRGLLESLAIMNGWEAKK
jgi:hypothetical protein